MTAIEFSDDFDVRFANAEALGHAEYFLDCLDEYKFCKSLHANDVEIDVRIGELYCRLGRADEAVASVRHTLAEYAKDHNDAAVAHLAVRLLDFAPSAFEEAFGAFSSLNADALAKHLAELESVADAFGKSQEPDPARRSTLTGMIASCYEKLLSRDSSNQELWQKLSNIDKTAAEQAPGRKVDDGRRGHSSRAARACVEERADRGRRRQTHEGHGAHA